MTDVIVSHPGLAPSERSRLSERASQSGTGPVLSNAPVLDHSAARGDEVIDATHHPDSFTRPQRLLHWGVASLVGVQLLVGLLIAGTSSGPSSQQDTDRLFAVHGGTGLLILALMVWRLQLRLTHGVPAPPSGTPDEARWMARLNHQVFYALLMLMPVLGWFALGARGNPLSAFGLFAVPSPMAPDPEMAVFLGRIHGGFALVLIAAIVAHLMGVIYHTYVRKDGLIRRMEL